MNLSLSKFFLVCIIAYYFTAEFACAQKFDVNMFHCSMSADNVATMNKIGKYEGHFYNVIFNTDMNDTVTVRINLYGRRGEYNKVQKEGINTTFIDGFYSGHTRQIYLYKTDTFMDILLHESSHALLHRNLNNAPKWLNEGIATLFGRMVIGTKDEVFYVKQSRYISGLKKMIRDGQFNMNDFFHYNNEDWFNADKREYLYTVSYCLIYFFAETNIDDLQHFMLLFKQGYSTSRAIDKLYGGLPQFTSRFLQFYATQSSYSSE